MSDEVGGGLDPLIDAPFVTLAHGGERQTSPHGLLVAHEVASAASSPRRLTNHFRDARPPPFHRPAQRIQTQPDPPASRHT